MSSFFSLPQGFGFIIAEGGENIFVHHSVVTSAGFETLEDGQHIKFTRTIGEKGPFAASIADMTPLNVSNTGGYDVGQVVQSIFDHAPPQPEAQDMELEDMEELDMEKVDRDLILEISKWKREAKAENNDRYFWHVREVDQIARGEKHFVIGRKGAGKTAICEYFSRLQAFDVFAEKLSFKNFPFNELYTQKNMKYTPPNQFISIWKYLIYSTVCRLMLKNEAIDGTLREQLSQLYNDDSPLSRRIGQWVGKEFGVSLFGLSIKVSKQLPTSAPEKWTQHLDFLEDLVLQHAGNATYYILFDELDEDYRELVDKEQYQQYTALITSLFKAVQDIRTTATARNTSLRIYPVIFLRDDIYELVQDSDKNKWGDFRVDLNWDKEKIKKVLAFRISRALNEHCKEILSFDSAWSRVFGTRPIRNRSTIKKCVNR